MLLKQEIALCQSEIPRFVGFFFKSENYISVTKKPKWRGRKISSSKNPSLSCRVDYTSTYVLQKGGSVRCKERMAKSFCIKVPTKCDNLLLSKQNPLDVAGWVSKAKVLIDKKPGLLYGNSSLSSYISKARNNFEGQNVYTTIIFIRELPHFS